MPYRNAKVYYDGGHYIAIPAENFPSKKRRKPRPKPPKEQTEEQPQTKPKELFDTAYDESRTLPKRERKKYIAEKLKDTLPDKKARNEFIEQNMERKNSNEVRRKIRLLRKLYLQPWNFFLTFTYADDKLTEETFKKKLLNTLKHLVARKGWKYIGVWERGGEGERLHFHGIFCIPDDGMIGEIIEVKDYSTKQHKMQITKQNTHFIKHFGRNTFQRLASKEDAEQSMGYIMKYMKKTGAKLLFGGELPTYFMSDILDDDVLCGFGVDEKKLLLADDFNCIVDGEVIGKVSHEVIELMPKSN